MNSECKVTHYLLIKDTSTVIFCFFIIFECFGKCSVFVYRSYITNLIMLCYISLSLMTAHARTE